MNITTTDDETKKQLQQAQNVWRRVSQVVEMSSVSHIINILYRHRHGSFAILLFPFHLHDKQ